jgi:hypothetical protein
MSFKLSSRQMTALEDYCRQYNTTPVRFIKTYIRSAIGGQIRIPDTEKVHAGQLDLLEVIEQIENENTKPSAPSSNDLLS